LSPGLVGIDQAGAAPGAAGPAEAHREQVGHQPRVASFAIGKWQDGDKATVEADEKFIGGKTAVFDLVTRIIEQLRQCEADSEPIDSDVIVGVRECSGPAPGFSEILVLQLVQEALIETCSPMSIEGLKNESFVLLW
jgi:hypothetical protein